VQADQVRDLLDRLAAAGVVAWVDGGWGVDALIGRQTREHDDLDLVVDAHAVNQVRTMLLSDGYRVVRDWLPTAIAFAHSEGRGVDLHPVELTADGGGDQVQLEGDTRWHYGPPTTGRIGDRTVACCTLETQLAAHLGYEPMSKIMPTCALADAFACRLPPPYDYG
jgi:lincosamide nucleotidyltransferase A/C/D/E